MPTSILVIYRQNTKAIALLLWPKMAHFHHFSICNQNECQLQFWSFFGQNTKAIALLFRHKLAHFHHFSICNQNECQLSILVIFRQNTKAIALLFGQKWLIFITFQSAIKISQLQFGHFSAKYQGYSLTFWPKLAHFHHFSICNQNKPTSILVIFGKIPRL